MPEIPNGLSQAQLRTALRYERKIELAGEGVRYFDILRWRLAEDVINGPCLGRIPTGILASAPRIDENFTPHYDVVPNVSQMRVIQVRRFDKNRHYLWPIPDIEIQVNKNLEQNPNY